MRWLVEIQLPLILMLFWEFKIDTYQHMLRAHGLIWKLSLGEIYLNQLRAKVHMYSQWSSIWPTTDLPMVADSEKSFPVCLGCGLIIDWKIRSFSMNKYNFSSWMKSSGWNFRLCSVVHFQFLNIKYSYILQIGEGSRGPRRANNHASKSHADMTEKPSSKKKGERHQACCGLKTALTTIGQQGTIVSQLQWLTSYLPRTTDSTIKPHNQHIIENL